MGFRRGDRVVYPKYGVGRVVKAEERPVFGRTQRCLEIKFISDNRRVFLQEDDFQRSYIRPVMPKKLLPRVWRTLREPAQYTAVRGPARRMERYETKTRIADPVSLAEVARDLLRRSKRHRLNDTEKALAQSAVHLLAEEIAYLEERKPEDIRTKLERMLAK